MKAILKKISTSILVVLLSVSLTFTNTAAVTYQAAAIPVVYSSWQVLVTILALLGITLSVSGEQADANLEAQAAEELRMAYVMWLLQNGYKEPQGDNDGDGQDDLIATFSILEEYLTLDNRLHISQEDLEAWQQFYYENMAPEVTHKPVIDVDISTMIYEDYKNWLISFLGFSDYSSNTFVNRFCEYSYDNFVDHDFTGVIYTSKLSSDSFPDFFMAPLYIGDSYYYGFWEYNTTSGFNYFGFSTTTSANVGGGPHLLIDGTKGIWACNKNDTAYSLSSNCDVLAFIVNGQIYEFDSLFTQPVNETTAKDWGTRHSLIEFKKSVNNLGSSLTDVVNTVSGLDLSNLLSDQNFDVIGNGREWNDDKQQAVGDIVVPMPSVETITDYSNGDASYEDLMNEMDMTPIDESTGTNLLTGEFLTIQTGIFSGVNSIVGILQNIWAWLNNLIDSIVQAFIDMLLSLFVPADGFIDGKIGLITDKLDSLGVAPYDMSGIFDSDDGNPFQNIVIDLNGQEVVIVSFDYLPPFLNKFRPVIRGLLVLFLVYYSINQLLSLIRLSGMLEGGNFNTLQAGSGSNAPSLDVGMNTPKLTDKGGRV